jgi:cytoskeletal protein CcmA (bactofilin family)
MHPFLCCLTFLTLIAAPFRTEVESSVESSEDSTSIQVSIASDSVHPSDIVITGDATIEGTVEGDIVISEGMLTLEGSTEGDVVLIGANFSISGNIKGDLVAIGGEGAISGNIEGDAVFISGVLTLDSTAVIEGDLTVVSVEFERDPAAAVKGDETEVSLGPLGKILVKVLSRRVPPGEIETGKPAPAFASGIVFIASFARLIFIAVLYLLGLLMLVVLPRWQRRSELVIERTVWKAVLTGVIYRLAVGGIFAILAISIIGWLLVPLAVLGWAFIALMGIPQAFLWVGRWIKKWLRFSFESRIGLYSLGFVAIYLVSIVSSILAIFGQGIGLAVRITCVIGFLIIFAAMTVGRGGIIYTLIFPREARALENHLKPGNE